MDAITGTTKQISYFSKCSCPNCKGTGSKDGKSANCGTCDGSGMASEFSKSFFINSLIYLNDQETAQRGFFITQSTCRSCEGSGKRITNPCTSCNNGIISKNIKLEVTIPPGKHCRQLLNKWMNANPLQASQTGAF